MPAWEYVTVVRGRNQLLTNDQLNRLGARGYELVNVVGLRYEVTLVGRRETRVEVHYFFKRPKASA